MSEIDIVFNVKDQGASQKIQAVSKSLGGVNAAATGIQSALGGFVGQLVAGNLVSQAITKTLNLMKNAVVGSIEAAIEAQNVQAQLDAVLRSTGNAVGMTRDQLIGLSKQLQRNSTFSDEAVVSAENLLLTFTNIGRQTFPQATQTVLDMSAALGQDLKSSAIQLGKALQDPILGITALRRVGVNFNEAQTETIKKMVESGHLMEAQKAILKELATEFGGSASAAANTFGGRLEQIKNMIGELGESIGNYVVNNKDLIMSLEGVVVGFGKLIEIVSNGEGFFGFFIRNFSPLAPVIDQLQSWAKEHREAMALMAEGKKNAEEFVEAVAKGSVKLNIFGVDVLGVAKNFIEGIMKPAAAAEKAIVTLQDVQDKYKIQTKTELIAALKDAEKALSIVRNSAEKTPAAVETLTKAVADLREKLYGKKEETIFDIIMRQRQNPKFLEPIPLTIVVTTQGGDLPVLGDSRKKLIQQAVDAMNPPKKLAFDWKGVADDISRFWQDGIADMVTGTSSFRDFVANSFKTLASGAGSAIGKMAGNALKSLGGIAGPIGSAIGGIATAAISGLGKLFGIKSKAEKEREAAAKAEADLKKRTDAVIQSFKTLGAVSDNTAKSIAEAAKTMGRARAEAKYFSDIIKDVGINTKNMTALWNKAINIIRDSRIGIIPTSEAVKTLDDAFQSLLDGTKKLGKEYGQNVARFMIQLRQSGMNVGSAFEYMKEQLSKIPAAFKTLIDKAQLSAEGLSKLGAIANQAFAGMLGSGSDFIEAIGSMKEGLVALKAKFGEMGIAADKSLENLFKISDIAAANQDLFESISANKTIIEGLGNSGWLTAEAMDSLSNNAFDFFQKLQSAGMTTEDSLRAMGPTLQRLYDYAKAYGLQVDENTQSIIDQAKAMGIVKDEADVQAQAMARVFDAFADRLDGILTKFGKTIGSIFSVETDVQGQSSLPGYASGGIAWKPQIARVAEDQPEAIIPLAKLGNVDAVGRRGNAGRVGQTMINIQISGRTLAKLIAPDLETLQRNGRFRNDISSIVRNET